MCAEEYGLAALTAMGLVAASIPSTTDVPEFWDGSWLLNICRGVVLPAPLGPEIPKYSLCAIWRLSLSTAVSLPNRFVRAYASMRFNVSLVWV